MYTRWEIQFVGTLARRYRQFSIGLLGIRAGVTLFIDFVGLVDLLAGLESILLDSMSSVEQAKEFSALGREMGLSGGALSSFVSERCQALEKKCEAEREAEREDEAREHEAREREKAREHELRMAQLREEEGRDVGNAQLGGIKLKVGRFDDARDQFDAYITKFEMLMKSQNVPLGLWVLHLISNLTGKALDVVNRMSVDDREKYGIVKSELLSYYHLTEEGYRRKFRSARPYKSERPKQFATRMKGYFDYWVEAAEIEDTTDALVDLVLREQFVLGCPKEIVQFVKERKCESFSEVVDCAEVYVAAHGPWVFSDGPKTEGIRTDPKSGNRHPPLNQKGKVPNQKPAGTQSKPGKNDGGRGFQGRGCYLCGNPGHIKRDCPMLSRRVVAQGLVSDEVDADPKPKGESVSRDESKSEVVDSSAGCVFFGTMVDNLERAENEVVGKLGMAYNDVGAMVNRMPVVSGRLRPENVAVSVLRDTGCSTCVVKGALVGSDQFTGQQQAVRLIDGTVRRFPVAKVVVDSPYFEGEIEAVCMPDCLSDVVIGNVKGAREPSDPNLHWVPKSVGHIPDVEVANPRLDDGSSTDGLESSGKGAFSDKPGDEVLAVQTRAQKVSDSKPSRGLSVAEPVENVRSNAFLKEQKDDESLRPLWQKVGSVDKSQFRYVRERGFLLRQKKGDDGQGIGPKVLVVPRSRREEIMRVAHDSLLGGHLGINNTLSKIKGQFYWSGMTEDVANFCRSCDVCQKTIDKGRVPKAPLGRIPLVGVPFQRIAIDLMGPFMPSARKHTHILTIVDYATLPTSRQRK